ncbi:MAG TPA: YidB family protein, partial [Vicinamibacterales bacterium]|nr:YidB family protein [Vicinamibacterales bacterium]
SILGGGGAGQLPGGLGGAQSPLGPILASLSGGNQSTGSGLLSAVMMLLQQNGGLGNVVSQFERSGLGTQAASWVGTGANQSISGDQVAQVFGSGAIGQIASQLGMDHGQASGAMAQLLPEVVNQLTPQGQITGDSGDMLSQALSMLRGS